MSFCGLQLEIRKKHLLYLLLISAIVLMPTGYPISGAAAKTVAANGNAKIDTSQSEFGGASGRFDGTNSYLSTPDSNDWYFGTGDFTIDFWVQFNSVTGVHHIYNQFQDASNYDEIYVNGATQIVWNIKVSGANTVTIVATPSPTFTTGTWYHIAVVRSGNNWNIYQGGTPIGSTSRSNSVPDLAGLLYVGAFDGANDYLNGWLDELRVSKGVARWTSNFTPPTAAYTSDSYTVLLLHMDGTNGSTTFTDDSPFTGPVPYGFNVKASATQIVVTLTYSWTGSGAPPQGSVAISAPSGTVCSPSCSEAAGAVYDRTSISVSTAGNTYNVIHRVTFTITAPGALPAWTAYVALSGVSTYTVTIEVS